MAASSLPFWSSRGMDSSRPLVYGCAGLRVDLEDVRLLHDPAGVHDRDPVGHVGDDAEVMGDEDQAHLPFLLQIS